MLSSRPNALVSAAAVVTLACFSAACSADGGIAVVSSKGTGGTPSTSTTGTGTGCGRGAPGRLARHQALRTAIGSDADDAGDAAPTSDVPTDAIGGDEVLECLGASIAFIETDIANGSGVVVEGGYVVTNGQVVDPFATVTVSFEGGERHLDVPVVGVDPLTDIAVLGPVDTRRRAIVLDDPAEIPKGDDVFLVGYPGETDAEPELTISKGVLSRQRTAEPFGLHYVQTDAAIGDGQSGGALIDSTGRAVGISGMHYNEFAYVLSGVDVSESVRSILAGTTPTYRPLPATGSTTTSSVHVDDPDVDGAGLAIAGAPAERTMTFSVTLTPVADGDPPATTALFTVTDLYTGAGIYANDAAIEAGAEATGSSADEMREQFDAGTADGASGRELAPGIFEVDVPADTAITIFYGADGVADLDLVASEPFTIMSDASTDVAAALAVGDELDGVIGLLDGGDRFEIDLTEGQRIHVLGASPTGDIAVTVQAPDEPVADSVYFDDSNTGIFGTDVDEDFRASKTGTYTIYLEEVSGLTAGYHLEVTAA